MSKSVRDFLKEFIFIVFIAFVLSMALRTWVIEARIVPSESMLPTIQVKDRLLVNKLIYHFKDPEKGDIIIFQPPDKLHAKNDFVKRVVAVPGDKVQVKNKQLYVNDQLQIEPYVNEVMYYDFGPVVVPANSYFVMGDNRNNSYDSHLWGVWLTRDHVIGKAFSIYWPIKHLQMLGR